MFLRPAASPAPRPCPHPRPQLFRLAPVSPPCSASPSSPDRWRPSAAARPGLIQPSFSSQQPVIELKLSPARHPHSVGGFRQWPARAESPAGPEEPPGWRPHAASEHAGELAPKCVMLRVQHLSTFPATLCVASPSTYYLARDDWLVGAFRAMVARCRLHVIALTPAGPSPHTATLVTIYICLT